MKKLFTLLLFLAGARASLLACSFYPLGFCLVASDSSMSAIVEFTIVEQLDHGIRVQVNQVWLGAEFRPELIIWDRQDIDCNGIFPQSTTQYGPVGTRIVAPLELILTTNSGWEVAGDYRASTFHFTDGYLYEDGQRWKSYYQGLDESIDIPQSELGALLSGCTGLELMPYQPGIMTLAPNPATQEAVKIQRSWSFPTEVTVYDHTGRIVLTRLLTSEEVELSVEALSSGCYVVESRVGKMVLRQKLMVQK